MKKSLLDELSPLTETSFYILLSLYQPLHGYGIMQQVEKMSDGRVLLGAGTLYGALSKLEKLGAIFYCGEDPENPRRKIYQISADGKRLIESETERIEKLARVACETLLRFSEGGR
jgi:DNA-binding PadR family transcriptional regulator